MRGTVEPAMQREASQEPVLRGAAAAAHTPLQGGDPAIGTAAASSNDRFAGFNDRTFTGTETYSAKPPYPCSRRLA
jgi:hypothetical protein